MSLQSLYLWDFTNICYFEQILLIYKKPPWIKDIVYVENVSLILLSLWSFATLLFTYFIGSDVTIFLLCLWVFSYLSKILNVLYIVESYSCSHFTTAMAFNFLWASELLMKCYKTVFLGAMIGFPEVELRCMFMKKRVLFWKMNPAEK